MRYRIRFHPLVARDLDVIARWILDYAGRAAADRTLAEIEPDADASMRNAAALLEELASRWARSVAV